MIKRLVLRNWKSHNNSEFAFSEGTNVLIGIMGSGKSSVMDAITFALFGTFPSLSQRKIRIEDVVLRGESDAYVELTFELDGVDYTIRRKIEKGRTSTSELLKESTLIESPQSSKVTEAVEGIIKMDYDLFVRAIYAEQNAIDYFLTIPRGQRMKKIDTLLKLDKFETARVNANSVINRLKDEKKTKMLLLERLENNEDIKSYERFKKDARSVKEKIEEYEKQNAFLAKEVESIRKEISALEDIERRMQELERKGLIVKTSISELEKRSSEISHAINANLMLTNMDELKEQYEKSQADLEKKESEIRSQESEIAKLKMRYEMQKQMEKEIKERIFEKDMLLKEASNLGDMKEIKSEIISKSIELDSQKRIMFSARSEIDHQKEHIQKLKKDGCPVCEREMDEDLYSKIKQSKERKISELEKDAAESASKIKGLETEIKDLDLKRMRLENILQKIESLSIEEKKKEEISKALDELSDKIPNLENSLKSNYPILEKLKDENSSLVQKMAEIKSINERKSELDKIRHRLEELYADKKKLESERIEFDPEVLRSIRSRYEKVLAQKASIESQILSERRLFQERKDRLDSIEMQKKTLESLKNEVNSLESCHKQLKLFSETLEVVQSKLRQEFVQTVNMVMSEIWREFYPYQDYTDIRLSIEEGDYVLELLSRNWLSVEGVASGGERSSAALVLRIALALVLAPNLRWLILDEPTHNLDANAIEQLSGILRHKISEFVDQVFLITHEPRLEDAVSGYLYRLDRPESKRTPTHVNKIDVMKD